MFIISDPQWNLKGRFCQKAEVVMSLFCQGEWCKAPRQFQFRISLQSWCYVWKCELGLHRTLFPGNALLRDTVGKEQDKELGKYVNPVLLMASAECKDTEDALKLFVAALASSAHSQTPIREATATAQHKQHWANWLCNGLSLWA